MVIVKIHGGLGNQLFQYSFALYLSKVLKKDVRLDMRTGSVSKQVTNRDNWLLNLDDELPIAEVSEIKRLKFFNSGLLHRVERKIVQVFPKFNKSYFVEKGAHTARVVDLKDDDVYFDGYWQSYFYPEQVKESLLKKFDALKPSGSDFDKLKQHIEAENSVSIHIRRGDYISIKANTKIYLSCEIDYYKSSVDYMKTKVDNPSFYIFTDDPAWVKKHFSWLDYKLVLGNTAFEDLTLMSKCKYNIIANSTFSWWAAWLNQNTLKLVICPKSWYVDSNISTDKFIPQNWIKL